MVRSKAVLCVLGALFALAACSRGGVEDGGTKSSGTTPMEFSLKTDVNFGEAGPPVSIDRMTVDGRLYIENGRWLDPPHTVAELTKLAEGLSCVPAEGRAQLGGVAPDVSSAAIHHVVFHQLAPGIFRLEAHGRARPSEDIPGTCRTDWERRP